LAVAGGGLLLAGIVVLVRTRGRALLRHER
jgi:hypothetical protein